MCIYVYICVEMSEIALLCFALLCFFVYTCIYVYRCVEMTEIALLCFALLCFALLLWIYVYMCIDVSKCQKSLLCIVVADQLSFLSVRTSSDRRLTCTCPLRSGQIVVHGPAARARLAISPLGTTHWDALRPKVNGVAWERLRRRLRRRRRRLRLRRPRWRSAHGPGATRHRRLRRLRRGRSACRRGRSAPWRSGHGRGSAVTRPRRLAT